LVCCSLSFLFLPDPSSCVPSSCSRRCFVSLLRVWMVWPFPY
jgi:hypothetical protein